MYMYFLSHCLSGSGVIVHVENLREPNYENRVREIDEEHVEALVKSMEYSYDEYVTLIGAVDAGTDINNLSVPGKATIEVIGGNHTRVAIKRLNDQGYTKTHVKMDAHHDLTVDEATFLGCRHNLIYETSKKMDLISGCLKSNYIYPRK